MDRSTKREMNTKFIEELRRTCESTNINFLLGAGCSLPAFGTLGNSEHLWEQLKRNGIDPSIAAASGAGSDEIERLIEAHLKAEFFTGAILPNKTYRRDGTTTNRQTITNYRSFCIAAMKLVAKREASTLPKQVTFFVTNYDICMDVALDQARIPTNSGYTGRFNLVVDLSDFGRRVTASTLALGYQSEIPSANLVKIHGCASWRKMGGRIKFTNKFDLIDEIEKKIGNLRQAVQPPNPTQAPSLQGGLLPSSDVFNDLVNQAAGQIHNFNSDSVKDLLDSFNTLQIVWPTKEKFQDTVLDEVYYAQLRRLTNQLEVRNSILIVAGFSFADEHIRKLILRAADTNPTLKVIILCYNKESQRHIRANLAKELGSILENLPNKNIVTVTGPKRTDGSRINLDLKTIASFLGKVTK